MTLWDRVDTCIVGSRIVDIQDCVLCAARQRFDQAGFLTGAATPHGAVFTAREARLRTLRVIGFFKDTTCTQTNRFAVDMQNTVFHLQRFAWQANEPFDVIRAVHGMAKDDGIAALGF